MMRLISGLRVITGFMSMVRSAQSCSCFMIRLRTANSCLTCRGCRVQVIDVDEASAGEALAMMTRTAEGLRPNDSTQVPAV